MKEAFEGAKRQVEVQPPDFRWIEKPVSWILMRRGVRRPILWEFSEHAEETTDSKVRLKTGERITSSTSSFTHY